MSKIEMSKLERLRQQREKLDKDIAELHKAEMAANRAADKQRKIIIGAWVMANRHALVKEIIGNLTRKQDQDAFAGWVPPEPSTPVIKAPAFPAVQPSQSDKA